MEYTKTDRTVHKYGRKTKETTVRYKGKIIGFCLGVNKTTTDRMAKNLIEEHKEHLRKGNKKFI